MKKKTKKKKFHHEFTIDCKKWARGNRYSPDNSLLNPDGTMCCLGFYARSCGAKKGDIAFTAYPHEIGLRDGIIIAKFEPLHEKMNMPDMIGLQFATTNDAINMSDTRRRTIIAKRFAARGVKVNFKNVGQFPPDRDT